MKNQIRLTKLGKIVSVALAVIILFIAVFFVVKLFSPGNSKPSENILDVSSPSEKDLIKGDVISINKWKRSFLIGSPSLFEEPTVKTNRKTEFILKEKFVPERPMSRRDLEDADVPKPQISAAKFGDMREKEKVTIFIEPVEDIEKSKELTAKKVVINRVIKFVFPEDIPDENPDLNNLEKERQNKDE